MPNVKAQIPSIHPIGSKLYFGFWTLALIWHLPACRLPVGRGRNFDIWNLVPNIANFFWRSSPGTP